MRVDMTKVGITMKFCTNEMGFARRVGDRV